MFGFVLPEPGRRLLLRRLPEYQLATQLLSFQVPECPIGRGFPIQLHGCDYRKFVWRLYCCHRGQQRSCRCLGCANRIDNELCGCGPDRYRHAEPSGSCYCHRPDCCRIHSWRESPYRWHQPRQLSEDQPWQLSEDQPRQLSD